MEMTPFEDDAGGDFRPIGGVAESRAGERWPAAMISPCSSVGLHQKKARQRLAGIKVCYWGKPREEAFNREKARHQVPELTEPPYQDRVGPAPVRTNRISRYAAVHTLSNREYRWFHTF